MEGTQPMDASKGFLGSIDASQTFDDPGTATRGPSATPSGSAPTPFDALDGHRLAGPQGSHPLARVTAADLLRAAFEEEGISVRLGATVERVGAGTRLTLADGETLEAEQLLVATGRKPNVEGLGLEQLGLEISERGIETDEKIVRGNYGSERKKRRAGKRRQIAIGVVAVARAKLLAKRLATLDQLARANGLDHFAERFAISF